MNIHINYDRNIYTYQLNAHIFDDMIDIYGHKIKYLIQASKFYYDEVYRYFMDIKGFNENFFYGKIIGIGPLNENYNEDDFKYIPNLVLNSSIGLIEILNGFSFNEETIDLSKRFSYELS